MSNIVSTGHQPVGTHLIVNLYDIRDDDLLCYLWKGRQVLDKIVLELNLNVVNEAGHQFQPFGYTYAYVLSESHMTIHTYPEHQSCYIDIFCCNPGFNSSAAITALKEMFNTNKATYTVIRR
jgi:S-adenosylmethionine decarboxylase proenzyme